jgi:hypothetical protein
MTEEEQAKQEWEKKSDIYGVKDHPYSEGFMDGIDLYQSSLKEVIDKRIEECTVKIKYWMDEGNTSIAGLWSSRKAHYLEFIKLLTEVTPKK